MKIGDVKSYLRVDYNDDDELIRMMMEAAHQYIESAVGKFDETNAKARLLFMAVVQDLYDNRVLTVTEAQRRRMSYAFSAIILQLQYEEGAAV